MVSAIDGSYSPFSRAFTRAAESPALKSKASFPLLVSLEYPGISLATTRVPEAMASSKTMPNDSPPSDGAQNKEDCCKRSIFSSSDILPSHLILLSSLSHLTGFTVSGIVHPPVVQNSLILFFRVFLILPQQYESGDEYPRSLPCFLALSNFIRRFTNRVLIADAII